MWHASAVCEGSLELWTGWARCCHSAHLYKKQSNILKFFAGSAFPTSTARTPLASAFEYGKNIRGLSVWFPWTLLCEHLNLYARQFLGVYCRCWSQKVLQSWMHWNVKQSSMAYRWFQWTKQVVFVKKKKKKKSKKKSLFQMTTFLFFSLSLNELPHKFLLDEHLLPSSFLVYFDCVSSQLTLQWTSMSTPAAAERTKVRCNFKDPFCSRRLHGEKTNFLPYCAPSESPSKSTRVDGILIAGDVVWSDLVSKHTD